MELNSVESTPNYSKFIKFITHCYTQCTVKLPSLKLRFFMHIIAFFSKIMILSVVNVSCAFMKISTYSARILRLCHFSCRKIIRNKLFFISIGPFCVILRQFHPDESTKILNLEKISIRLNFFSECSLKLRYSICRTLKLRFFGN